ncbi:MAG: capsular biosynthesis protein [Akkermansiaceae bacterium]
MNYRGRNFLFLQGLATPFFSALGRHLREQGASTLRVNFCPGDELYWRGPSMKFRGTTEELQPFYASLFDERGFTDVALFGDTRTVHQPALVTARTRGVRVHVFEEGYLRPYWVTVERGGVNAHSPLPRDPAWYLAARHALDPEPGVVEERNNPTTRALQDMGYHLSNAAAPLLYPRYQTHRPRHPAREYAGWAWRLPQLPLRRRTEEKALHEILAGSAPVFFFPLQLTGDSQMTKHSSFSGIAAAMETVIKSFAQHAPLEALLMIKNHPLDTGLDRHKKTASRLARQFTVEQRVHFFETGHLPTIADRAQGTVVVNSTVGLAALGHGCPVKTLADPIYNLPGMTFQGGLDEFWKQPTPPDRDLYRAFRDVLLATTQVNGNFFTKRGIALAVQNCDRMLAEESPLEALRKQVERERGQIDLVKP